MSAERVAEAGQEQRPHSTEKTTLLNLDGAQDGANGIGQQLESAWSHLTDSERDSVQKIVIQGCKRKRNL
jgi:hypothetical protein